MCGVILAWWCCKRDKVAQMSFFSFQEKRHGGFKVMMVFDRSRDACSCEAHAVGCSNRRIELGKPTGSSLTSQAGVSGKCHFDTSAAGSELAWLLEGRRAAKYKARDAEQTFIYRNCLLLLYACALVWSSSSCCEATCSLICFRIFSCVCVWVGLCGDRAEAHEDSLCGDCGHGWGHSSSVCVCVLVSFFFLFLQRERHRLLHMKCYSYKAALAWLSPRNSTQHPIGETQQNKSWWK